MQGNAVLKLKILLQTIRLTRLLAKFTRKHCSQAVVLKLQLIGSKIPFV